MRAKVNRRRQDALSIESIREVRQIGTPFRRRGAQGAPPRLSVERARQLVRAVLPGDEDEAARALIELVAGIAYEPDALQRDALALFASSEAFSHTQEFSRALDEFATPQQEIKDGYG